MMSNQEFIKQAERAKAIMASLCEKLDQCYEKHCEAEQQYQAKKAA